VFKHPLIRRPDWQPPAENPYRLERVKLDRSAIIMPNTPRDEEAPAHAGPA
jgi:hypothetical protein